MGAGSAAARSVEFHPQAVKDLSKLDKPDQQRVKATIEALASGQPVQTHALREKLKGWNSTKATRGHRIVHRNTDDGGIHVGYVGLHDYDQAIRRLTVKQGGPVTIQYARNTEKSPSMGSMYGQDIEPHGRYLSVRDPKGNYDERFETGEVTFSNPLHMEFGGNYGDPDNWKRVLSDQHGGKKGKALSRAVVKAGHDGIITRDEYGPTEVVDLTHLAPRKAVQADDLDPSTRAVQAAQAAVRAEHPQLGMSLGSDGEDQLQRWLKAGGHPRHEDAFLIVHDGTRGSSNTVMDRSTGAPGVALHPDRTDHLTLAHETAHLLHDHHTGREFGEDRGHEYHHGIRFMHHYADLLAGFGGRNPGGTRKYGPADTLLNAYYGSLGHGKTAARDIPCDTCGGSGKESYGERSWDCRDCDGSGTFHAADHWDPPKLTDEHASILDEQNYGQQRRRALDLAKNPTPGTHVWRSEIRHKDDVKSPGSVGMHWTVKPEMVILGHETPEEKGHTADHRHVVWQGTVDHPDQTIPRSHPIWHGKHQSLDTEAEVRFRPGAKVKLNGAYVWNGEGPPQGSPIPRYSERTKAGWDFHPLDHEAEVAHKRPDDGLMKYREPFPDLFKHESAKGGTCGCCGGSGEHGAIECYACDSSGEDEGSPNCQRECPCGLLAEHDPIDGWQHMDGSVSHDLPYADQSVSDLMKTSSAEDDDSYRMQHRPPGRDGIPIHDMTNQGGDYSMPADVYTHPHYYSDMSDPSHQDAHAVLRRVRGKPESKVRIYRALPAEHVGQGFRPGDWVTTSKSYVVHHGKHHNDPKHDWPVISTMVKADDLHTDADDLREYGYNGEHKPMALLSHKGGYHQEVRQNADGEIRKVKRRVPKEAAHPIPTSRIFGPTKGSVDPRLFEGDRLRGEVRSAVLGRVGAVLEPLLGLDWQRFTRVYLAGSEASEWYGNNDFDTLIGIDYDHARDYALQLGGLDDSDITDMVNSALKVSYNASPWKAPFGWEWDLTGYCNPGSYDITRIKPYAAYNITDDVWAVRPPHLPDWSIEKFPEGHALLEEAEGYASVIEAIDRMPEPYRTQQGKSLWHHLHTDRSRAFSDEGEGWMDPGNAIEKALVEWGLWDKLVEWQYGKQKTAGAQGDLPEGIDYEHKPSRDQTEHTIVARHPQGEKYGPFPGGYAGHITWWDDDGEISGINVVPSFQRKGLATELHRRAREITPHLVHADENHRTDDGKAWIHSLASGPLNIRRGIDLTPDKGWEPEAADRIVAGKAKPEDLLKHIDTHHAGYWWYHHRDADLDDAKDHALGFGDEHLKQWHGYGEDGKGEHGNYLGSVGVAMEAHHHGHWDPQENPDNGLMGNSYLPDHSHMTLHTIHYTPDYGDTWHKLNVNVPLHTDGPGEQKKASRELDLRTKSGRRKGISHTTISAHSGDRKVGHIRMTEQGRELDDLHVVPEMRGQGVARTLMGEALRQFGHNSIRLHASPFGKGGLDKDSLQGFYASHGFEQEPDRPAGYMIRHPEKNTAEGMRHQPMYKTAGDYRLMHTPPDENSGKPMHHFDESDPDEMVRIYRSAPPHVDHFDTNTWATTNPEYAHLHGRHATDPSKDWPVMSAEVPKRHVFWDENDGNEVGYQGPRLEANEIEQHHEETDAHTPFTDYEPPQEEPERPEPKPKKGEMWGSHVLKLSPQDYHGVTSDPGSHESAKTVLKHLGEDVTWHAKGTKHGPLEVDDPSDGWHAERHSEMMLNARHPEGQHESGTAPLLGVTVHTKNGKTIDRVGIKPHVGYSDLPRGFYNGFKGLGIGRATQHPSLKKQAVTEWSDYFGMAA